MPVEQERKGGIECIWRSSHPAKHGMFEEIRAPFCSPQNGALRTFRNASIEGPDLTPATRHRADRRRWIASIEKVNHRINKNKIVMTKD